jgi:hypothetical protein
MSIRQSQPFTDRLRCGMLPHVGSTLLWFTASTGSFVTIDHDVPIWLLYAAWTLAWTYHIQQGLLSDVSCATHARALCRATSRCGSCALMRSVERVHPNIFSKDIGAPGEEAMLCEGNGMDRHTGQSVSRGSCS